MTDAKLKEIIEKSALKCKKRLFPGPIEGEMLDVEGRIVGTVDIDSAEMGLLTGRYKRSAQGVTTLDTTSLILQGTDIASIPYFMVLDADRKVDTNVGYKHEFGVALFYDTDRKLSWPKFSGS